MMNYKDVIELVLATAAEIGSVLFKDTKSDVINCEYNSDAKHRFAKNDKQHYSCIPFAGLQQGSTNYQVTEKNKDKAHRRQ